MQPPIPPKIDSTLKPNMFWYLKVVIFEKHEFKFFKWKYKYIKFFTRLENRFDDLEIMITYSKALRTQFPEEGYYIVNYPRHY